MPAIRLLIADQHEAFRRGVRALIQEQEPDWEIAAEVADGRAAVVQAKVLKPAVAILDIVMPTLNGLDAAEQIVKLSPHTKVLISTLQQTDHLFQKILAARACGYILKTDATRDLIMAVKTVL